MAIFIGEKSVCALEAGSGNARKGSLVYLRPSKAHFVYNDRLRACISGDIVKAHRNL